MFAFPFFKRFRSLQIKRPGREIELQEIFLDRLTRQKEEESGGGEEKRLEVPLAKWILGVLYVSFFLMIAAFFGKAFYLQTFTAAELREKAQLNTVRSFPLQSERGVMYDSSMKQLVRNKPSFDFVCDNRYLPQGRYKREKAVRRISEVFGMPFEKLRADFEQVLQPEVLVEENLSHEQLILAETRIHELEGCEIQKNTIREYVEDPSLSHVLGYTAKISVEELQNLPSYFVTDQIGRTGIEKAYESQLRGNPGRILVEKDALGKIVREHGELPLEPGDSLILWLDFELQKKIEDILIDTLESAGAEKAVGIALDPHTGGVLALVSIPGFNNNLFSQGISQERYEQIITDPAKPLFNRAVAGMYPVGSTIKPLVAAAALQENIIDPDKKVLTKGFIEVPHQYDSEIVYTFRDWKNHGWVNMRDSIAVSSNVYFYMIGGGYEDQKGLGPSRIKKYLSLFGWGSELGIDFPGEAKGLIPDPEWKRKTINEGWWDGDTYLLSIGQGNLLATPLQVAAAFVPIANGGTLYKPKMVKGIVKASDSLLEDGIAGGREEVSEISPEAVSDTIIDPENLKVVREGMRQAVTWGSSVFLNQLPVQAAAKTGTAQTGKKDAQGEDYLYSWVTVFAPYDDPEIVLTILVEEAKTGSFVVLPVAKEVLNWYFSNR